MRPKPSLKKSSKRAPRRRPERAGRGSARDSAREALARVREFEREQVRRLELLTEVSALLNSTLEPTSVGEKALEAMCRLVGCETGALLLVDEVTRELRGEAALGEAGRRLREQARIPLDETSIAGRVALRGEVLRIDAAANDPRCLRGSARPGGFVTRNLVCLPLRARGRVIGVLQALNKHPAFTDDDVVFLTALGHSVAIAVENSRLYSDLKGSFYSTVEALAEAIEKKDRYTGGHTKRVVHYSGLIAGAMGLGDEEIERIRLGALLHDVGKIGVEDRILKKESPLDDEEWKIMMRHPDLGHDIMSRSAGLGDVMAGMRYHHERWDGNGYPSGLAGEAIPLIARVIAVADTYDAMVSTRPYRRGIPARAAFEEIVRNAGTQFDPRVVEAFVRAFRSGRFGAGSRGEARASRGLERVPF